MGRRKDGTPRSLPGSDMLFLAPPPVDMVWRQEPYKAPRLVPRGEIIEQVGPPLSGKTVRATAWEAEDPENRRVVDGDRKEAARLAGEGYDVMLNLLPEML